MTPRCRSSPLIHVCLIYFYTDYKRNSHQLQRESVKTTWRNCLVWVESTICCESAFAEQNVLWHFAPFRILLSAARSITNEQAVCLMHYSASPWHEWGQMSNSCRWDAIPNQARHNGTTVCGDGSRDLIRRAVSSRSDTRWGTRRWVCWPGQCMNYLWPRNVLCESYWARKGVVLLKFQPITLVVGHDLRLN